MRQSVLFFVVLGIMVSGLVSACNRSATSVVKTQNEQLAPKPEPEKIEMAVFDRAHMEGDEVMDAEPTTREGATARQAQKARRERIARTGVQETIVRHSASGCAAEDCPEFTFRIMTDNSLRYEGKANVELIGKFTGEVPFNPMTRVVTLASGSGFFRMGSSYPPVEDISADDPTNTTMVHWRGRKNTITYLSDSTLVPKPLIQMDEYLKSLVTQATWTEVLPEADKQ